MMAELELADEIVLVQESTNIDIQEEVQVMTQSTRRKGLRSRQIRSRATQCQKAASAARKRGARKTAGSSCKKKKKKNPYKTGSGGVVSATS